MSTLPVFFLGAATVTMGATLARGYVRGERRAVLNSIHLILGTATLAALAIMQSELPDEGAGMGKVALACFAAALILGLSAQLTRPEAFNRVLVTHASCGALGFILFLLWATRL